MAYIMRQFFFFFQPSFSEPTRPISTKFSQKLRNREHSDSIETEFQIFVCGAGGSKTPQNTENSVIDS